MKILLTFFIASFLISTLSFGQTKVSQKDLEEVMMLSKQGKTDKALNKINSLRKTVTTKDSLYVNLIMTSAEINIKAFNCESVITDNEEILQLVPTTEIECQSQIAQFKKYLGDFEGAILGYNRILQLDPTNNITFNNMASAYNSIEKYQDAIRVLNSNPNEERLPNEYFHYAVAYFKMNKLDSAKLSIDKYLITDNSSNDFFAYKVAAQIYSSLGDKKKSCKHITKANDIISTINPDKQISKLSVKIQGYYFIKETLNQIDETKKLKLQICKSL